MARGAATAWAMANGGKAIGMTPVGETLEVVTRYMRWPMSRPLRAAGLRWFARGAVGPVRVFQNALGIIPSSIPATDEHLIGRTSSTVTDAILHTVWP